MVKIECDLGVTLCRILSFRPPTLRLLGSHHTSLCQKPFLRYVALLHFPEQFLAFYNLSSPSIMATTPQGRTIVLDAEAKIEFRDKNVSWYEPKLKRLSPSARELLENYSKIPPVEVEDHIYKMVSFVLNWIRRS
jgi:hypothetical protein